MVQNGSKIRQRWQGAVGKAKGSLAGQKVEVTEVGQETDRTSTQ